MNLKVRLYKKQYTQDMLVDIKKDEPYNIDKKIRKNVDMV